MTRDSIWTLSWVLAAFFATVVAWAWRRSSTRPDWHRTPERRYRVVKLSLLAVRRYALLQRQQRYVDLSNREFEQWRDVGDPRLVRVPDPLAVNVGDLYDLVPYGAIITPPAEWKPARS